MTYNFKRRICLPSKEKYGMLPQALFPDTFSACHKRGHADLLDYKAREYCLALRASDEPRKLKEGFMKEVFNILAIDLGTPPGPEEEVVWEYEDKDGKAQKWCGTPLDSYRQFVKHDKLVDPINGVCIVNDPRNEYDKLYTIRLMGNVWGASGVKCKHKKGNLRFHPMSTDALTANSRR